MTVTSLRSLQIAQLVEHSVSNREVDGSSPFFDRYSFYPLVISFKIGVVCDSYFGKKEFVQKFLVGSTPATHFVRYCYSLYPILYTIASVNCNSQLLRYFSFKKAH